MRQVFDLLRSPRARSALALLCIAAAITVVYGQVYWHDFVNFDDPLYIYGNSYSIEGLTWDGVLWAWYNSDAANWHPMTWLSHMVDCEVFGVDVPGLHILENAGWHLLNSFLVYWFLRRFIVSEWVVLAGALFFAVHPVNVEAVAWASQRKSLLNLFLMLVALHGYLDYVGKPGFRRYAVSLLAFALSLTAKSMSVTFPVLLLLLDAWPLRRLSWPERHRGGFVSIFEFLLRSRRVLLEKVPFIAISVWLSVVTIWAQVGVGAAPSVESFPMANRAMNAFASFGAYFRHAVIPSGLGLFYPMRDFAHPERALLDWSIALGLLLVTIWATVRRRPVAVGLLWYWVTLLPVIGLMQVGSQAMADRYFYLPGLGLVFAAASVDLGRLLPTLWRKYVYRALLPGYIAMLAALAYAQVVLWKYGTLIYAETVENCGHSWHIDGNLGATYFSYGQFDKALATFESALTRFPQDVGLHSNRAMALLVLNRDAEALAVLKMLESNHLNRPGLAFSLAVAYFKNGDPVKAQGYVRLARIMLQQGRTWDLQQERIKSALASPGFRIEAMVPRVCAPAEASSIAKAQEPVLSLDQRR